MYTELVNATLLSADPTAPETVRRQAAVFLDGFLISPESFKISVEIFDRGNAEFSSITRMFCLTVIEHCVEQKLNSLNRNEWDSFKDKLWEWYKGSIRDELFIKNKLIKVLTTLFGKGFYDNVSEFFGCLLSALKEQSASLEDYYLKVEMFLNVCKTLNEELITTTFLEPDRDFVEKSNEIKDSMREGVLEALISEWVNIMNSCYSNGMRRLITLCLDTVSGYITWMPIKLSTNSDLIQCLYQYVELEPLSAAAIECITQITLKKMSPIDRLILVQSLDIMPVLDKLIQLPDSPDVSTKVASLINALGMAFCDGWKSEKSTAEEKDECLKQLDRLRVYTQKVILDYTEEEVISILYPYLNVHLTIIASRCKGFSTATQAGTHISLLAELQHTIVFAMKYSENHIYSDSDVCDDDFPYAKKRMVLKKLFTTIGSIVPDLQISYVFQVVEQTFKSSDPMKLSWTDVELALFLISIVIDTIRRSVKNVQAKDIYAPSQQYPFDFHKVRAMIEHALAFGKTPQHNGCIVISYLQVLYKHYQYFEVHENLIPEVLEYIFNKRSTSDSFQQTQVRGQYVLRYFIKNLKSQLSLYVEAIMAAFKNCLCDVLNTPPTEDEQKELKTNPRNHSPSSVNMFEAIGGLILAGDIPDSKKFDLLKGVVAPIADRMGEIMRTNFYLAQESPEYMMYICKLNHIIIALGNICKDFTVRDSSTKKFKGVCYSNPYAPIFTAALDTMVEVLKVLANNFFIRTAVTFTFRRIVDCSGEQTVKYLSLLISDGILNNMSIPEVADILHLFAQVIAKLEVRDEIIAEMMCRVLDKLNSLSLLNHETGTDHQNDMVDLQRNYVNLISHILQLKDAYKLLIFLRNTGYLSAITNSLINFCYESDYLTQRGSLSSVVKLISIWGKGELGTRYEELTASVWNQNPAENASLSPSDGFMYDFKIGAGCDKPDSLPGLDSFLLEKVIPMLFGILESSNLKTGDSRTRCIVAEVTKAHFEILKLQGYKYPYYLGRVFFQSANVPSPYANNILTVLSANDHKACNNLLSNYAAHISGTSR